MKKEYVAMLLQDRKDLHADLKSRMKERNEREDYQGSSRVEGLANPAAALQHTPSSFSSLPIFGSSTG